MTRHLTHATLANWLATIGFVVVLFGVVYQIDRADAEAERLHALDMQAQAADARMHRAAQALCQAEAGPGTQALWTHDGDLVCRPALLTTQARGVSP